MRCLNLVTAILSLAIVITPSLSYADGVHLFGSTICRESFPCPGNENALDSQQLAATGSSCLATLGVGNASSFDPYLGLDSNNCLTTIEPDPNAPRTKISIQPRCCVIQSTQDQCVFQCDLTDK